EAQMNIARVVLCAVMTAVVGIPGVAPPGYGADRVPGAEEPLRASVWQPRSGIRLDDALQQSASAPTIPLWSGSFGYQGMTYPYVMVGRDPTLPSKTTKIPVVIVPIEFDLPGGVVLSPDARVCGGSRSAVDLTKKSPIFQSTRFVVGDTDLGNTQY